MEKINGLLIAIIVVALLLSAIGGAVVALVLGDPDWTIGPIGPAGQDGIDGVDGLDGLDGINGTQGPEGDRGPQGPQGGSGPAGPKGDPGPQGEQGPPGEDCQCNEAPVVTVNTSSSYCEPNTESNKFVFRINITVDDLENDVRIIDLYHKHHENEPWIRTPEHGWFQHWWSDNNSDFFTAQHIVWRNTDCREIWWLVEVDDGLNLVVHEEHVELCKPVLPGE